MSDGSSVERSLGKLPVQVENMRRTRPFVQIVDILGDDPDVEIAFQTGNRPVGGVRLGLEHFGTPLVVETDDAPTIEIKRFGNADLLDPVIPPCSVGVAERRQTAVGADAGAGEDNKFFSLHDVVSPGKGNKFMA